DKTGKGYFVEMRGLSNALPLDYRVRGERYTKHFRPRGAIVSADRRSAEMHAGWRFITGARLRGRLQAFDDLFQTGAEIETRTAGLNLSGPLGVQSFLPQLNGVVDFFVQTRDNELRTVDTVAHTLSADLNHPLAADWFGRFGVFMQKFDDQG